MARKLRIAASVFFAVVTLALVVMWVRSYRSTDLLQIQIRNRGEILLSTRVGRIGGLVANANRDDSSIHWSPTPIRGSRKPQPLWQFERAGDAIFLQLSIWFVALLNSALIAFPWLPFPSKFSLRTLLIATTLFAVVLGLGVWLAS